VGQTNARVSLYRIGKDNHLVGPPTLISCDTDDEAVAKARELCDPLDTELWDGKRRIACFKGRPDA
jgi:hypothetical protein